MTKFPALTREETLYGVDPFSKEPRAEEVCFAGSKFLELILLLDIATAAAPVL